MEIVLEKTYESPRLTMPHGFQGETITYKWWGGNVSLWKRNEDGSFAGWRGYDFLKTKLSQWDERECELPATRRAMFDLGVDYIAKDEAWEAGRKEAPDYTFTVDIEKARNTSPGATFCGSWTISWIIWKTFMRASGR